MNRCETCNQALPVTISKDEHHISFKTSAGTLLIVSAQPAPKRGKHKSVMFKVGTASAVELEPEQARALESWMTRVRTGTKA